MHIKEAISRLKEREKTNPDLHIAYCGIWTSDDLTSIGDREGIKIDSEQSAGIIDYIDENFDAGVGINWSTLYKAVDLLNES